MEEVTGVRWTAYCCKDEGGANPPGVEAVIDDGKAYYDLEDDADLGESVWIGRGGEIDTGEIASPLGPTGSRYGIELRFGIDWVDLRLASLSYGSPKVLFTRLHRDYAQLLTPWPGAEDAAQHRPVEPDFRKHRPVRVMARSFVCDIPAIGCAITVFWDQLRDGARPQPTRRRQAVSPTPAVTWVTSSAGYGMTHGVQPASLHFMMVLDLAARIAPDLGSIDHAKILDLLQASGSIDTRDTISSWTPQTIRNKLAYLKTNNFRKADCDDFESYVDRLHIPLGGIAHNGHLVLRSAADAIAEYRTSVA